MRGAQLLIVRGGPSVGIIPAYAGSTRLLARVFDLSGDHPRVCGEHRTFCREPVFVWGSSPRMRGARVSAGLDGLADGIIPAYAGSTETTDAIRPTVRDHPRVCGEHYGTAHHGAARVGSSPRMRGALDRPALRLPLMGIIPAYAGSTPDRPRTGSYYGDHPRVCGEHKDMPLHCDEITGSSPRMRGALRFGKSTPPSIGIIPAYAGSTPVPVPAVLAGRDHPRVCGEHTMCLTDIDQELGSSPRMRGALFLFGRRRRRGGIIPAYAGSTWRSWRRSNCRRDHPRVCGEHAILALVGNRV